jgi:hypothetical protein
MNGGPFDPSPVDSPPWQSSWLLSYCWVGDVPVLGWVLWLVLVFALRDLGVPEKGRPQNNNQSLDGALSPIDRFCYGTMQ